MCVAPVLLTQIVLCRLQSFAYPVFYLFHHFRVVVEEGFYGIAALADLAIAVTEPGTALVEYAQVYAHIDHFAYFADTFAKYDIELYLAERGRYFIFYHFYAGTVTAGNVAIFYLAYTANVQAY